MIFRLRQVLLYCYVITSFSCVSLPFAKVLTSLMVSQTFHCIEIHNRPNLSQESKIIYVSAPCQWSCADSYLCVLVPCQRSCTDNYLCLSPVPEELCRQLSLCKI
jgi:hypothetical protein